MPFGEIITARFVAAILIGMTILGVSIVGVMQGFDNIETTRSVADARRVAGMLEAVDHKPGTVARLNFVQPYSITLEEGSVTLRGDVLPVRKNINLHSDVSSEELNMVQHVCISNDGEGVELSQNCGLSSITGGG